jgi:hypothetical protein
MGNFHYMQLLSVISNLTFFTLVYIWRSLSQPIGDLYFQPTGYINILRVTRVEVLTATLLRIQVL